MVGIGGGSGRSSHDPVVLAFGRVLAEVKPDVVAMEKFHAPEDQLLKERTFHGIFAFVS